MGIGEMELFAHGFDKCAGGVAVVEVEDVDGEEDKDGEETAGFQVGGMLSHVPGWVGCAEFGELLGEDAVGPGGGHAAKSGQLAAIEAGDEAMLAEANAVVHQQELIGELCGFGQALECTVVAGDDGVFRDGVAALGDAQCDTRDIQIRRLKTDKYDPGEESALLGVPEKFWIGPNPFGHE